MESTPISMFSSEDLAEMTSIRRQMDELRTRYDRIVAKYQTPASAAPSLASTAGAAVAPTGPASIPAPASGVVTGAREILSFVGGPDPAPVSPASAAAVAAASGPLAQMFLKDAVIAVVHMEGKPLSFDKIYEKLQTGGAALPSEKPMLVVRKILFDASLFHAAKGAYRLK